MVSLPYGMEPYYNIRNMIIERAMIDYTMILAGKMSDNAEHGLTDCETFFRGPWFEILSDDDPEAIIQICKKAAKKILSGEAKINNMPYKRKLN